MNPEGENSDSQLDTFHDPKTVLKNSYESVQEAVSDHQKLEQLNVDPNKIPRDPELPQKPTEPETRHVTAEELDQLNLKPSV